MKFSEAKNLASQWCGVASKQKGCATVTFLIGMALGSGPAPLLAQHVLKSGAANREAVAAWERHGSAMVYPMNTARSSSDSVMEQVVQRLRSAPDAYFVSPAQSQGNFFRHFLGDHRTDVVFRAGRGLSDTDESAKSGSTEELQNAGNDASTTPEPSTIVLLGTGCMALVGVVRRGRRSVQDTDA